MFYCYCNLIKGIFYFILLVYPNLTQSVFFNKLEFISIWAIIY